MVKRAFVGCIAVVMIMCGLVWADDPEKDVKDLVNKAVQAFQQYDKEYALRLFNASVGPYRKGELYVIVLDFKGMMLAHPAVRKLVGKSQWDFVDANGKYIAREQIKVAKEQGEGWMEYAWLRPGDTKPTPKRTFVKRVPGTDILVAVGYYPKR